MNTHEIDDIVTLITLFISVFLVVCVYNLLANVLNEWLHSPCESFRVWAKEQGMKLIYDVIAIIIGIIIAAFSFAKLFIIIRWGVI
jgi:uncharacterized membrane protein